MDTVRRFPPILSLSLCSHRAPARRGRLPTRMGRTATGRAGSGVHSEKNERSKQSSQRKEKIESLRFIRIIPYLSETIYIAAIVHDTVRLAKEIKMVFNAKN